MPSSLFSLPSSLLLLSLSNYLAAAEPWPYNLPKHEKYWPEHEEFVKRDAHIRERVARQPPAGVQKMSHDPGEKFYLDYWQFEELNGGVDQTAGNFRRRAQALDADTDEQYSNSSLAENLLPPLLLHSDSERSLLRFFQRNLFEKRDYQCPTGTSSCASISRPNSCCPTDETCVIVEDTGLGDVGCCPAGSSCSGSVSQCNSGAGYTSCPESDNGGCCIPGYSCQDVGCIISNTVTMTTTLSPATSTISSTRTTSTSRANPTTTTSSEETTTTTTTEESTASTSTEDSTTTSRASTSTTPQGTLTCSTGFRSCPASLGGGCCPTDRACGSAECPASSTSSSATGALPPVRPTGTGDSVTSEPSSTSYDGCPTGFYACSAYYQGGCCRVGRDCQKTSCPAVSTTGLVSNGITIVAQTGASFATESGSCATGWSSCAASLGGGCCPSGYGCGSSCTYTATGTASASAVQKVAPSAAPDVQVWGWLLAFVAWGSGVAMLAL
ncbi:hypothetical protein BFW01_g8250 [Lasiodiplodia theobromae]|uniref:Gpi anchored protein n=1 Tax=Lasiodiplodia theobromae TaxID=45133 RepID=UPI0015C32F20|nr:Gpi anchored protein [Lasiodiplodia theobromae]KAF4538957.1 Gpi anchored protein [Lasiodiplodia theobromae]KAF9637354.1 hypothetical protein BFW01_g8250 [Lasiodiplodia theobromae]